MAGQQDTPFKADVAYMPVPRCETCAHWRQFETSRLGGCDSPKMIKGYGLALADIPDGGVEVENDEGWAMNTDRNFGCVQWKEKA